MLTTNPFDDDKLREECGVFGIYAVAGPESIPEVMTRLRHICDDLRRNGITQREFERSREYLKGSFALGLESPAAVLGNYLTIYWYKLAPDYWDKYPSRVNAVTGARAQEIVKCVSPYLDQDAARDDAQAEALNAFIWAFNLPGYRELAGEILGATGALEAFCNEEHVFRLAMAKRNTPLSLLWCTLGPDRAALLPGRLGNMLVSRDGIAAALDQTQRAFAGKSKSALLQDLAAVLG